MGRGMSRTNHVPERGRVYVRRFDHEEAAQRYAAGERVADLAVEYGVGTSAVYRAVNPESKRRKVESGRRWRTGVCEVCGGPAMRVIAGKAAHNPDGRCLCRGCRADLKFERRRNGEEASPHRESRSS